MRVVAKGLAGSSIELTRDLVQPFKGVRTEVDHPRQEGSMWVRAVVLCQRLMLLWH